MLLQLLVVGAGSPSGGGGGPPTLPTGPRLLGHLTILFVDETGVISTKLRIRRGETKPVRVKLLEDGNPVDLTAVLPGSLSVTVGRRNQTPIVQESLSLLTPYTDGVVEFVLQAPETATVGRYLTEVVGAFFQAEDRLKFPSPGESALLIIDNSLISP